VGGYLPGLQPALVSETLMPGGGSTGGIIVPKQPPVEVVSEPVLPPGASEKLHESPPSGTTETVQIGNLTFSGVRTVNLPTPTTTPQGVTSPASGGSSGTTYEAEAPPSTPVGGSNTGSLGTGGTTSPKSNGGKTTTSQPRPTPPPVVGSPSPEHNAILTTPIESTSAPPHATPPSEAKEVPTNVITHLWIGWRIEPEVEEFIRRFIETFEHGRPPRMGGAPPPGAPHLHPPIMLPAMGIVPTPGVPFVVLPPQGTEQKQRLTSSPP
jgi:hypothetical protein